MSPGNHDIACKESGRAGAWVLVDFCSVGVFICIITGFKISIYRSE